jgi:hypothetical protein
VKEDTVERRLQRRCARAPFTVLCVKGEPLGTGWPDRILLAYSGRIAFVELKRPGGLRRRRQEIIGAMLRALGFECDVLDSLEAVDRFMDDFVSKARRSPWPVEDELWR